MTLCTIPWCRQEAADGTGANTQAIEDAKKEIEELRKKAAEARAEAEASKILSEERIRKEAERLAKSGTLRYTSVACYSCL